MAESCVSASTTAGTANSETAKVTTPPPGISSGGSFLRINPGERRMESRPDSDPDPKESAREASARGSTSTQLDSPAAVGDPRARVSSAAEADAARDGERKAT